jgi:succinyl-CoA synthetase beta subunit
MHFRDAATRVLDEPTGKALLAEYSIATPRGVVVLTPSAAAPQVRQSGLRFPLAAKLISPDAIHKSDIGGVILGLQDYDALEAAIGRLCATAASRALRLTGLLIEEMAPRGHELLVGGFFDERFGPCIMLGTGGIYVEVLADASLRVCPLDPLDAQEMIDELRSAPLLRGARGQSPVSESAIVEALLAVGGPDGLLMQMDEIAELDINPLMVSATGAVACDARVVLRVTTRDDTTDAPTR